MKKGDFVKALAQKSSLSEKDAQKAVDVFTQIVGEKIKKGEKVQITGFGTFELKKRKARTGINPATGEKIKIKAVNSPNLKFSKAYRENFN